MNQNESANFSYDDGGRELAGFKGSAGDCVVRAIAIAANLDYKQVYTELRARSKKLGYSSPRNGVHKKVYEPYLKELGFKWVKVMGYQTGCTTHFKKEELPNGTLIARLSRHLSTMVDGVIKDTYDPSRDGKRCVYGYWIKGE